MEAVGSEVPHLFSHGDLVGGPKSAAQSKANDHIIAGMYRVFASLGQNLSPGTDTSDGRYFHPSDVSFSSPRSATLEECLGKKC